MSYELRVGAPPRGGAEVEAAQWALQRLTLNYALGTQPAQAEAQFIGSSPVPVGAAVDLLLPNYSFPGICMHSNLVIDAGGTRVSVRFADSRHWLWTDVVFGAFNQVDEQVVNGRRVRRWWHVLPADVEYARRSYTSTPYSADLILGYLLNAPTVESPWTWSFHAGLDTPALAIDAVNGRKLGDVVAEVLSKVGLEMFLTGRYHFAFARLGEGVPVNVPVSYTRANVGVGFSGAPNRVRLVGDRNRYQVLNVTMVADWATGWQKFYDESLFADFVYRNLNNPETGTPFTTDDAEQLNRWAAAAYAHRITLKEFSAAGQFPAGTVAGDFEDFRWFAGRSRMEMPVVLYLRQVLFRAFRPSLALFNAGGRLVPVNDLRLIEENLVAVDHAPGNGAMSHTVDAAVDGEGYAIARGYQVWREGFRDMKPERIRVADWQNFSNLWQRVKFQVDESPGGQFILCEQPVIKMNELVTEIDGLLVLKAVTEVAGVPDVQAALTFEAERFSYVAGNGWWDEVQYLGGLRAEYVRAGGVNTELPFDNGDTATQVAGLIAGSLLDRSFTVVSGGWEYPGTTGQGLNGQISRVVVSLSPERGLTEEVDFALTRVQSSFVPEADLTRSRQVERLFPGGDALHQEAQALERIARVLRNGEVRASFYGMLLEAFGYRQTRGVVVADGTGTLPVGTPLWVKPYAQARANTLAALPAASTDEHQVLAGVTIFDGDSATKEVTVATGGVVPVRVRGPVTKGESLRQAPGADYLVSSGDGEPAGVTVLDAVPANVTRLVLGQFGGGGVGGGEDGPVWL
jgi:hypothetical protein